MANIFTLPPHSSFLILEISWINPVDLYYAFLYLAFQVEFLFIFAFLHYLLKSTLNYLKSSNVTRGQQQHVFGNNLSDCKGYLIHFTYKTRLSTMQMFVVIWPLVQRRLEANKYINNLLNLGQHRIRKAFLLQQVERGVWLFVETQQFYGGLASAAIQWPQIKWNDIFKWR